MHRFPVLSVFGLLAATFQHNEVFDELRHRPHLDDSPLPPRPKIVSLDDDLNYGRAEASQVPLEWRVPCRRPDCLAPVGSPCKKSTLDRRFVHGCRAEDAKKLDALKEVTRT